MELITSNWQVIGAVLVLGIGGFYVPVLRQLVMVGFRALLSEAVMKRMLIILAEKLVKSTKNKLDDLWFSQMKRKLDA